MKAFLNAKDWRYHPANNYWLSSPHNPLPRCLLDVSDLALKKALLLAIL